MLLPQQFESDYRSLTTHNTLLQHASHWFPEDFGTQKRRLPRAVMFATAHVRV